MKSPFHRLPIIMAKASRPHQASLTLRQGWWMIPAGSLNAPVVLVAAGAEIERAKVHLRD